MHIYIYVAYVCICVSLRIEYSAGTNDLSRVITMYRIARLALKTVFRD